MTRQIHRFHKRPSRKEIFQIWNAAKRLGEIPQSWTFARHGEINRTWWGFALLAR